MGGVRSFSTTVQKKDDDKNGFSRLTKHYRERVAMEKAIEEVRSEMTFNHLPYGIRFFMFLNRIKFRLFVLGTLVALFNYWGNLIGIGGSRLERVWKKYKKRWIFRYNKSAMVYTSAVETTYEPKLLSRESTDKLSQLFIKMDRELDNGFSR